MSRQARRIAIVLVVLVVGWLAQRAGLDPSALLARGTNFESAAPVAEGAPPTAWLGTDSGAVPHPEPRPSPVRLSVDEARIEEAFAKRESGFMVTVDARVEKTLRDDLDGSRHQRFLIELGSGRTLLVAHNIDLADRVDLAAGDRVRVRGQYEWNDKGGVLHWTHHDPDRRRTGGFIEHDGRHIE